MHSHETPLPSSTEAALPPELRPEHLQPISAAVLAEGYGVAVANLPDVFGTHLHRAVTGQQRGAPIADQLNDIHQLYEIWQATRDCPELEAFSTATATAEAMQQTYPDADILRFTTLLNHYRSQVLQPGQLIELSTEIDRPTTGQKYGMYGIDGEWVRMPTPDNPRVQAYARRAVLAEAATLEAELPVAEADLFHASGSAALHGLAERGALLSARKRLQESGTIVSGEYLGDQYQVNEALEEIYMSNHARDGYSTTRWFNEYPVVFGFSSVDLEQRLAEKGIKRNLIGYNGDGHHAGDEVPLSACRAVYAPKERLAEVQAWAAAVNPNMRVISLEASEIMRQYSSQSPLLYPDYLYAASDKSSGLPAAELAQAPSTTI